MAEVSRVSKVICEFLSIANDGKKLFKIFENFKGWKLRGVKKNRRVLFCFWEFSKIDLSEEFIGIRRSSLVLLECEDASRLGVLRRGRPHLGKPGATLPIFAISQRRSNKVEPNESLEWDSIKWFEWYCLSSICWI